MIRPVLAVFRLPYYKHARARGVEISTYGPYLQKQKQNRNEIKNNTKQKYTEK